MVTSVAVMICRSLRIRLTRLLASAAVGLGAFALVAAMTNAQPPEGASVPPDSVNVDVAGCIDLETREQQIACYLARVEEAVDAREVEATGSDEPNSNATSSAPSSAAQTEPRRANPPAQRDALQARPQPQRDAPAAADSEQPDAAGGEIVARVTSLREMEPDTYLIFLDNGQVWRQNAPKRYFLLEGAEVHLSPTRWGESYRLTDPDIGNFIQVERIR
ncbi:MAG TPA: hypothetical protein VMR74_03270 [Gammaproteobacteria bacterium]|nr:hypothetical protein [Gammaproteobacteria bacterium]